MTSETCRLDPFANDLVTLGDREDLWSRCFTVAPLVLIGTTDAAGTLDFAPKHMAMPLGWGRYFGFVCTPRHSTQRNAVRAQAFTVTYPLPSQVVATSLAAEPRDADDVKHSLRALPTFPAQRIAGAFVRDGYLFLECTLERVVDGLGDNSLIVGHIVAAHARRQALRNHELDDQDVLAASPILAYLHPGRFTTIAESDAFPFPAGFRR